MHAKPLKKSQVCKKKSTLILCDNSYTVTQYFRFPVFFFLWKQTIQCDESD